MLSTRSVLGALGLGLLGGTLFALWVTIAEAQAVSTPKGAWSATVERLSSLGSTPGVGSP